MSPNVDEDPDDPDVDEDTLPLTFEQGDTIIIPSRYKTVFNNGTYKSSYSTIRSSCQLIKLIKKLAIYSWLQ